MRLSIRQPLKRVFVFVFLFCFVVCVCVFVFVFFFCPDMYLVVRNFHKHQFVSMSLHAPQQNF